MLCPFTECVKTEQHAMMFCFVTDSDVQLNYLDCKTNLNRSGVKCSEGSHVQDSMGHPFHFIKYSLP